MAYSTGCDGCSRFVPSAADEAAEMVECEVGLRSHIATLTAERDAAVRRARTAEAECERLREERDSFQRVGIDAALRARDEGRVLERVRAAESVVYESLRHCDVVLADKAWFGSHPTPVEALDNLGKEIAASDAAPKGGETP
jgi:hypothetical protein